MFTKCITEYYTKGQDTYLSLPNVVMHIYFITAIYL